MNESYRVPEPFRLIYAHRDPSSKSFFSGMSCSGFLPTPSEQKTADYDGTNAGPKWKIDLSGFGMSAQS